MDSEFCPSATTAIKSRSWGEASPSSLSPAAIACNTRSTRFWAVLHSALPFTWATAALEKTQPMIPASSTGLMDW